MKAVYIAEPGGPEKLIYGDRLDPEARPGKAKELGADAIINYTTTPHFSQRVKELTNGRGVDVVFDCVGAAVWDESLQSLKPGGLRGVVGRTFELAEAAKAHEVVSGRDFFGKLVLRVP
jgi:NADPH:quinone reductase-like Zn-dependent oxidoreductase